MALIEVEMTQERFNSLLFFLATAAPIPIGVASGLGPGRLIAAFAWGPFEIGVNPPGFAPPAGTLIARSQVQLRHVSTAELDANANAAGVTTAATAWVSVMATKHEIRLDLIALDIAGKPTQWFTPGVPIASRATPGGLGSKPAAAAFLIRGNVVTLRFATRPGDSLTATPLNLLDNTSDHWGIRLSGDVFAEQLAQALQEIAAKPPSGTSVEDSPSAGWGWDDGAWSATGSIGLKKADACPGLFGDVDLSVTVNVRLTPTANLSPPAPPPQLMLSLDVSSDVSDWDSFRCWLGNGGIAGALLGYVTTPLLGPGIGGEAWLGSSIASLIAIAETVRLEAGHELTGQDIKNFTLVSSSSTAATYSSQKDLPSLVTTLPNGSTIGAISAANTGPYGMFISGTTSYFGAVHNVTFVPAGLALAASLVNSYDCGKRAWKIKAKIQAIQIEDHAAIAGNDLGVTPVTVFPTTTSSPSGLWIIGPTTPDIAQYVPISGTDAVGPGSSGRIYLHTSAGLRRYDIPTLAAPARPTDAENAVAIARCLNNAKIFTRIEEILWSVDPPAFDYGRPALRQWLFSFNAVPAGAQITLHPTRGGERLGSHYSYTAQGHGDAAIEIVTTGDTELLLEHTHSQALTGRGRQRWILPLAEIEMGEPAQTLSRSGSALLAGRQGGIFQYDLATGIGRHQTTQQAASRHSAPFSLTLPNGRVALVFGSKLVVGIPG